MSVEVVNESSVDVDSERTVALTEYVLRAMHVHPSADVSIMFIDPEAMEKLHIQWMDESGPTDVLSFPMDELRPGTAMALSGPGTLGDVVLCPQVAAIQAAHAGHPVDVEMDVLLAHGMLHLLGYDHAEPEEERRMFRLQAELVAAFREEGSSTR